jgi:hypothetical protein
MNSKKQIAHSPVVPHQQKVQGIYSQQHHSPPSHLNNSNLSKYIIILKNIDQAQHFMLGFASNVAQHQQNQLYSNAPTFAVNPN